MKKGIAFILLLFLLVTPLSGLSAGTEKNGYTLTPLQEFGGGIALDSEFLLTTEHAVSKADIETRLSIDGEQQPLVTQKDANTFVVQPAYTLESGRLYTFRLTQPDGDDLTWVFQTMFTFAVTNVFPGDQTSGVPLNSGIEITFNYEDYEDIEPYFHIEPQVNGTFERHKKTAVFVPEALAEETIYTVTLKGGLKLTGTDYSLGQDITFQFETERLEPPAATSEPVTSIYFSSVQAEFTPQEAPKLSMRIYTDSDTSSLSLQTDLYHITSAAEYLSLWRRFYSTENCYWSAYHRTGKPVDTSAYTEVVSFQQNAAVNPDSYSTAVALTFPQKLPEGFYLVHTTAGDSVCQMLVQITNTAGYYQNSSSNALLWLNDNQTKKPLENVVVLDDTTGQTYRTDRQGIALIDKQTAETTYHDFILTTADGKTSVMLGRTPTGQTPAYWSYLELDRPLYQPKDYVNFWGYAAGYGSTATPETVKVRLSASRYFWYASQQPILQQNIQVQNNVFAGQLELPYLDPGYYTLTIESNGNILCSEYLHVAEYIKPDYQLTLEADKNAVFTGETIHYTMQTSFFDGTPVSNLPLSYNLYSYPANINESGSLEMNQQGSGALDYTVPETQQTDKTASVSLGVRATLPEGGEISSTLSTRTFLNDVAFSATSPYDTDQTRIEAQVNLIDLTRLNDGTAKGYYDYLGDPVAGKTVQGTIYYNYYEKEESGTYYDYYNKVTRKRYRYSQKTKEVKTFTQKTDADGKITYPYSLSKKEGWYTVRLTTTDNNGKQLVRIVYLRTKDTPVPWYRQPGSDYYHLELQDDREKFQINDEVSFLLKNNQNPVKNGTFLFLTAQNGLRNYTVQDNSAYTHTFAEQDIPRVSIKGVYFDGTTYHNTYENRLSFDFSARELQVTIQADQDSYRPGDTCTLSVHAERPDGTPAQSTAVNLSLVDEALFALEDREIDVLSSLYQFYLPSGLLGESYTHYYSSSDSEEEKEEADAMAPNAASGGGGGGSTPEKVRSDFQDTADFRQLWLDENGNGVCTIPLPDNITTWRLTASAITPDRYAATVTSPIKVSLPFFVNCSLGSTFLAGDTPQVGLSAYGKGLEENETVTYTVFSKNDPQRCATETAAAYERVYLPLWSLAEGSDTLVIQASTARGSSDALEHPIRAVSTYYEAEKTVRTPLTAGMTFAHGEKGNTRLIFTDRSRGALLSDIYNLLYQRGDRLEQRLSSQVAYQLIQAYGDDIMKSHAENYMSDQPEFKVSDYQTSSGGMSLFTYSSADLDYTAKLLPLVKDDLDKTRMVDYLYTQSGLNTENAVLNAKALYGLAVYQEPVLLYLDQLSQVENLSPLDAVYCALAYLQVGGQDKAQELYDRVIVPLIEEYTPYCRVNTGRDQADILETTALAACLASQLGAPQREGFYQYALHNYSEDYRVTIEKLMYVSSEIKYYSAEPSVITYRLWGGEYTKTLKNGACHSIELASQSMDALEILSVTGDVDCLSCFTAPLENEYPQSDDITVSRQFFRYGTGEPATVFHANDIIQVVITVQYGEKAANGCYEVTDLLPSGLKFLSNTSSLPQMAANASHICYGRIAGQKVQFYSSTFQRNDSYTYLARVQSPGTYTAAGTLVQSTYADGLMHLGAEQQITILPE